MKIITRIIGIYFNFLSVMAPKVASKQAFYIFCYPFKAKLKPHQQKFLESAEKFNLKVAEKNVQYYKWGNGPESVLLVHGWQSNSYRWKAFIEHLDKEKFTLITFDAPGHGNSESKIGNIPLYEESIASLINKVGKIDHFIGHSIGSFACSSYIHHAQYSLKSFSSLATPYDANEFLNHFKNQLKLSKRVQSNLKDYFKEYTGHSVEHYSLDTFSTSINSVSALIVHDKDDSYTWPVSSKKLYENLKVRGEEVELMLTEGLTHNLRSQEVLDAVLKNVNIS